MRLTLEIKSGCRYKIEFERESKLVTVAVSIFPCDSITKKISLEIYQDLIDRIMDINFAKVLYENSGIEGIDGYTLTLTLSIDFDKSASVAVWCPKATANSETAKFMKVYKRICELVSDIFPRNSWDAKRNEPIVGW